MVRSVLVVGLLAPILMFQSFLCNSVTSVIPQYNSSDRKAYRPMVSRLDSNTPHLSIVDQLPIVVQAGLRDRTLSIRYCPVGKLGQKPRARRVVS